MTRPPLVALGALLAGVALAAPRDVPPSPQPEASPSASPRSARPRPSPNQTASPRPTPSPARRSLGELQKGSPPPKRVYGNQDLPSPSASPPEGKSVPTPPAEAQAAVDAGRAGDEGASERYWRQRADRLREEIRGADQSVRQIEEKIAALRNDLAPTNLMDPNREQTRQAQIHAAIQELEAAKGRAADLRKALDDLEEEARRKGVPPGWLRER